MKQAPRGRARRHLQPRPDAGRRSRPGGHRLEASPEGGHGSRRPDGDLDRTRGSRGRRDRCPVELADQLWDEAGKFSQAAKVGLRATHQCHVSRRTGPVKRETWINAKTSKAASRQAERIFAKYGLGSHLLEASLGDSARWFADKTPYIRAPAAVKGGWLGKVFRVGRRVPLVGSLLTIGGIAYDIKVNGNGTDVAVVSNVASLGAGMAGTWAGAAAVCTHGGGQSAGVWLRASLWVRGLVTAPTTS